MTRVDAGSVGLIGPSRAQVDLDFQARCSCPPARTALGLEPGRRFAGGSGGAIQPPGEQGRTSDQHQRFGQVDVGAVRPQVPRGSLGDSERLAREAGGEERLGAIGEQGRTAQAERGEGALCLREAAEGLHEVTTPSRQPRQVVAHVSGALGPSLRLEELEGTAGVRFGSVDVAGPAEQHEAVGPDLADECGVTRAFGGLECGIEGAQRLGVPARPLEQAGLLAHRDHLAVALEEGDRSRRQFQ